MFSLTIIFGTSPNPWVLLFKPKEAAEAAMDAYRVNGKTTTWEGSDFMAVDDFGQVAAINRTAIHGVLFEDLDQSKMVAIELGLHRARTQARAEQMASGDPILKAASMRQAGNAMLTPSIPGFNGAFRQ